VAVLDGDPGQPEATPPGLLSLHVALGPLLGPPHLRHAAPAAARFLGDVSPEGNPAAYVEAVHGLVGEYRRLCGGGEGEGGREPGAAAGEAAQAAAGGRAQALSSSASCSPPALPPPPLVVNTMGWITGVGYDLLCQLLCILQPTHVLVLGGGAGNSGGGSNGGGGNGGGGGGGGRNNNGFRSALPPGVFWHRHHGPPRVGRAPRVMPLPSAAQASAERALPDANGGGASGGGGGATGAKTAAECRTLGWLAWARRAIAASGLSPSQGAAADGGGCLDRELAAAAVGLAAATPLFVRIRFGGGGGGGRGDRDAAAGGEAVRVVFSHAEEPGSLPPHEAARALNGSIVGLLAGGAEDEEWAEEEGGGEARPGRWIRPPRAPAPQSRECVGLGLVRAVEGPEHIAYVLTDVTDPAALSRVCMLAAAGGRLELPAALQQCSAAAAAAVAAAAAAADSTIARLASAVATQGGLVPPYHAMSCLTEPGTGASAGRSRSNLLRASLLP